LRRTVRYSFCTLLEEDLTVCQTMPLLSMNVNDLTVTAGEGFATHVTADSVHPALLRQAPLQPTPPVFVSSPSKNPCMVRVGSMRGTASSRYRNDPYGCKVLPPLMHHANVPPVAAPGPSHRRLVPLPPAMVVPARKDGMELRVRAQIARAQEFAVENESISPDASNASYGDDSFDDTESAAGSQSWAMVRLKYELVLYSAPIPVQEGDFVVLEGDRGENIGRVHSLVTHRPPHPVQCRILRLADDSDIEAVKVQREKEEAAKHFAQGVSDALELGIRVVDTEFQTDGNKLTVYFTSRRQIDFRRLQRQMFKQYRCRIWLVNWAEVIRAK